MTRFVSTPAGVALTGVLAAVFWVCLPLAAVHAQEEGSQEERLQRIEERLLELDSMVAALESLAGPGGASAQQSGGGRAMTPPRSEPGARSAADGDLAGRVEAIETQIQALSGQMQRLSDQIARMQAARGASTAVPGNGEAEGRRSLARQDRGQPSAGGRNRSQQDGRPQQDGRQAGRSQEQGFGTTTVRPEQQSSGGGRQEARLPYGSRQQRQDRQSGTMPWLQSPSPQPRQQAAPSQQQGNPSQREGASSRRDSRAVARADPEARAAYEAAYNRLLQRDFQAAASGFREFLEKHPDDPLAGNAQYWLGETYYVRGEYREAAESFLNGYRNYRSSDKAPSNLLKLGMSLYQLGEQEDACSAFSELEEKFPGAPAGLQQRAASESERAGC